MKITQESQKAILSLYQRGVHIRQISQILKLSRNTVRWVLRGKWQERPQRASPYGELSPLIREVFNIAQGNVVRVQEILQDQYGRNVPYSTLTRITAKGHPPPFNRERSHEGPCTEEKILLGQQQWLDPFIEQLKSVQAAEE